MLFILTTMQKFQRSMFDLPTLLQKNVILKNSFCRVHNFRKGRNLLWKWNMLAFCCCLQVVHLLLVFLSRRTYLKLPWKPLIKIDGTTVYELNDELKVGREENVFHKVGTYSCILHMLVHHTFFSLPSQIIRHAESWSVSALEAVGQIFSPSKWNQQILLWFDATSCNWHMIIGTQNLLLMIISSWLYEVRMWIKILGKFLFLLILAKKARNATWKRDFWAAAQCSCFLDR